MLSRTGIYALQAAMHLAQQPPEALTSASVMAEHLAVPSNYLAKVLNRLTREGILESTRGARGGYRLAVPAEALSVADVVSPFEEPRTAKLCLLGGPCNDQDPCTAHRRRLEWHEARQSILRETTVAELLRDPEHPIETEDAPRTPNT